MNDVQRNYLPSAGRDWALPLYDPLVKLLGGDKARRALLDQADLRHAHRVLDIGCDTGTLATLIKHLHPMSRSSDSIPIRRRSPEADERRN